MEIFKPYIFPQTAGTVEEIKQRSNLGQAKFPRLVGYRNQLLVDLMKGVRAEDLVPKLDTFRITFPITEGQYILNFDPKMDAEQLSQIVSPCIEITKNILQHYQIPIPDDLLSRVYVIEEQTFNNVILQELDENPYLNFVATSATLPNRLVILSGRRVRRIFDRQDIDPDQFIRTAVMSELIGRSLVYKEAWIPQNENPPETPDQWGIKRHGLIISSPKIGSKTFLMTSLLHEGFTQYFTSAILEFHGDQVSDLDNPSETLVIAKMADEVGIEPLFRTAYLQEGFRDLAIALQERYGKGAFHELIRLMDIDRKTEEAARRLYNVKYPPFKKALEFLSEPKA